MASALVCALSSAFAFPRLDHPSSLPLEACPSLTLTKSHRYFPGLVARGMWVVKGTSSQTCAESDTSQEAVRDQN